MTLFLRVLDAEDKGIALLEGIRDQVSGNRFEVDPQIFKQVPGSPFAYWVSERVRALFTLLPAFEVGDRKARQGLATADDFRFVRTWWEVAETQLGALKVRSKESDDLRCAREWRDVSEEHISIQWFSFAKGGDYSPYYSDVHLMVNWRKDGEQIKGFVDPSGRQYSRPQNTDSYFRPGLTWPLRTTSSLGFRAMPAGCIFSTKGTAAFVEGNCPAALLSLLAITTSLTFRYLVGLQMAAADAAARSYEVGVIQRTPVPFIGDTTGNQLAVLARRAWSLKRALDTANETSHAFVLPTALLQRVGAFEPTAIERDLTNVQSKIDDITFLLYGIEGEDRAVIERWANKSEKGVAGEIEQEEDDAGENEVSARVEDQDALLSWCVGVAFGRFDLRLATGERAALPEPEPFEPLPTKSPGMVPDGDEPLYPASTILVDDPGHGNDLGAIMQDILERLDASNAGALSPEAFRVWLAKKFFPLHIKMYSKSRRKAPIYWQLATPSASYSVWLYVHAFTKDTLYNVQNDYVAPKLAHEERKLNSMRGEFGPLPSANERKQLAAQELFVEELQAFLDEVRCVAPLWSPNLDDGIVINFAPLSRLVPQHKSWQKELNAAWEELCAGAYDWAHLAMHLWPERVIPKCATDRSLAIAHGLEGVFWVEGDGGKWTLRKVPERPINELVHERTSPAVKAALKNLIEAPVLLNGRRNHRSR